jgi:hypothetical protein
MYRDAVDQATRNDIAAAAAHHDLGRDYDDAVAESLVDRIGAEIDKRVDARLGTRSHGARSPEASQAARNQALVLTGGAIGAGATGLVAILANVHTDPLVAKSVMVIWIILAVIGLGAVLVRKYREHG